jgi:hypothetical protein
MTSPQSAAAALYIPRRRRLVECVAHNLQRELGLHSRDIENIYPGGRRFLAGLEQFPKSFIVREFDESNSEAAFIANTVTGQLEFNINPLHGVYRLIARRIGSKQLRRELVQCAVENFMVHEFYHAASRLTDHSDARLISRLASPDELAVIDLYADIFAAKCCSILACHRKGGSISELYYSEMLQQLIVGLEFWVPLVKAPPEKPHKQKRFMGAALMAARLAYAPADDGLPLDTPLWPWFNLESGELLIMAWEPDPTVWAKAIMNVEVLRDLSANIDSRPAAITIEAARRILISLGKLPQQTVKARTPLMVLSNT